MLSIPSRTIKKKVNRVKTPTHILLFADSKQEAMKILTGRNKSLSGFVQEKIDELVNTTKTKEVVYMQTPAYQNIILLDPNLDPYNYDYPLIATPSTDVEAEVSLSFSQRQRFNFDSI